jgi:hypothetical protein
MFGWSTVLSIYNSEKKESSLFFIFFFLIILIALNYRDFFYRPLKTHP